MKISNYNDFLLLEARKSKAEVETAVMDFIKKGSKVETSKDWPNEQKLYSLSSIIKGLKGEFKSEQISNAVTSSNEIKSITVNVPRYGRYPYYYLDISDEKANEIKEEYEKEVKGEEKVAKKAVAKKRVSPSSKSKIKRKEK